MNIRLTQIDGKLPNLALMKLAHWHKSKGDTVLFQRSVTKQLFEPDYDKVYGSAIFSTSQQKIEIFKLNFPAAIIGGTGTDDIYFKVEHLIGCGDYDYEHYDYSIYPDYKLSIGFTQRGCRLRCKFCVVPVKEGKISIVNSINDIWRGLSYPKEIVLLDNDFFGQSVWQERCNEILQGDFKVSFNQGINIRLIHQAGAEMLAQIKYYDADFKKRRLYTAWDNKRDEGIFMNGINMLLKAGISPHHIMVYMLCGYWPGETFTDCYYRFEKMKDMGLMPYPMVYPGSPNYKQLKKFQQWVIRRYYQVTSWESFNSETEKQYYERKAEMNQLNIF